MMELRKSSLGALLVGCVLAGVAAGAMDLRPPAASPFGGGGSEPSLLGVGGILDQLYGLENLTRVADSGAGETDQYWTWSGSEPRLEVAVRAKYGGERLSFGVIDGIEGGEFTAVAHHGSGNYNHIPPGQNGNGNGNGKGKGKGKKDPWTPEDPTPTGPISAGDVFRLGLQVDGHDGLLWSSADVDNGLLVGGGSGGGLDRMSSWVITGNSGHAGNNMGNYIVAWESSSSAFSGDFNDMVLEVGGIAAGVAAVAIPEPMTIMQLMLGTGFAFGFARRGRGTALR